MVLRLLPLHRGRANLKNFTRILPILPTQALLRLIVAVMATLAALEVAPVIIKLLVATSANTVATIRSTYPTTLTGLLAHPILLLSSRAAIGKVMLQCRVTQVLPLLPLIRRTAMPSKGINSLSRLKNMGIRASLPNNHIHLRMLSINSSMITSPSSGVVVVIRVTEVVTSLIMLWVLLFALDSIGLVVLLPMQAMATANNTPPLITSPSLSRNRPHTVVNPQYL